MYDKNYFVYLLYNTHNERTYLGITDNPKKSIKQHNGEIKGGARYTLSYKENGLWKYYLLISNLTKNQAFSIERIAKNRRTIGKTAIDKRLNILLPILEEYSDIKLEYLSDFSNESK